MAASGGETLTTVIAVVGCGLSIYNTITARLDKRPKVKLKVAFGMVNLANGLSQEKVFFQIGNGGTQASQIVSLYIPLPSKSELIVMPEGPSNLPASVIANGAQTFWMDYWVVYDTLVREGLGLTRAFELTPQTPWARSITARRWICRPFVDSLPAICPCFRAFHPFCPVLPPTHRKLRFAAHLSRFRFALRFEGGHNARKPDSGTQ